MVKNVAYLNRKFKSAPPIIHEKLRDGLERIARDVVAEMQVLNPLPADIRIAWTWGDVPRGAVSLGAFGRSDTEGMTIKIYARARTFAATWFEFGTAPRFHKSGKATGQIIAQPFFYPTWRANRRRVKARLTSILRRAVKQANELA